METVQLSDGWYELRDSKRFHDHETRFGTQEAIQVAKSENNLVKIQSND